MSRKNNSTKHIVKRLMIWWTWGTGYTMQYFLKNNIQTHSKIICLNHLMTHKKCIVVPVSAEIIPLHGFCCFLLKEIVTPTRPPPPSQWQFTDVGYSVCFGRDMWRCICVYLSFRMTPPWNNYKMPLSLCIFIEPGRKGKLWFTEWMKNLAW